MKTRFIEATQGVEHGFNYGKFAVCRFDAEEWGRSATLYARQGLHQARLLARNGWSPDILLVLDLQTGEGAIFRPGGSAIADLDKHRVWVCPMFEPFLGWLYEQDLADLDTLPELVELPGTPAAMAGYRRGESAP